MTQLKSFEKEGAMLLAQSDGCSVWQFRNGTGDGTMTAYEVFPGVMLTYNDFHMERYHSGYVPDRRIFAVDHCREGRMEYAAGDGLVGYTAPGDIKLDLRKRHIGDFIFPSCHYHGLTVAFDLDMIDKSLSEEIKDFPVSVGEIISRFDIGDCPRILRGLSKADGIFGDLYRVPETIRIPYFKVKILELLLYLNAVTVPKDEGERPYFYRTQAEKIKAIGKFLTENISENFTQQELSKRFDIPLTAMKACFRSVYGESIGCFVVGFRMNRAAELLIGEEKPSIAEIAGRVGYDNPGKFTAAFKKIMKMTPSEYRREKRGLHYEI